MEKFRTLLSNRYIKLVGLTFLLAVTFYLLIIFLVTIFSIKLEGWMEAVLALLLAILLVYKVFASRVF